MPADSRLRDPEVRRKVLESQGIDTNLYDIDPETSTVISRPSASQNTTSSPGAFGATAAYYAPEAAAGLAAGRIGSLVIPAALRALGAAPHPLAKLGGFVGGALAGPLLASPLTTPLKESLAPGAGAYVAQAREEHPIASELGQAASALVGLRPSLAAPAAAARGVRSLIAGVPLARLSAAQTAGLTDVGVASALGAGIPLAEDISAGREVNIPRALAGAAGNVALSAPNVLGRRLFGLQPIPQVDTGMRIPRPAEMSSVLRSTAQQPVGDIPSTQAPADNLSFPPEVFDALKNLTGREFTSAQEVEQFLAPLRELTSLTPRKLKARQKKLEAEIKAKEAQVELAPEAERVQLQEEIASAKAQLERFPQAEGISSAIARAREVRATPEYAPWETEGGMPGIGERESSELSPEEIRARAPWDYAPWETEGGMPGIGERESSALGPEEIRARDYASARAEEAAQQIPIPPEQVAALQEAIKLRQILRPQAAKTLAKLKQKPPFEVEGRILPQAEPRSAEEMLQDELEGTGARYQPIQNGLEQQQQLPPAYRSFMQGWAKEKGVEMEFPAEVRSAGGELVAGKLLPSASRLGTALAQVSERAGLDTPPHELLHNLVIDLMRGTPGERRFAQRLLTAYGGNEEALVQASGEDFARRLFEEEKGGLWKDLEVLVRDRFLRRPRPGDAARLAANTLRREGSAADRLGTEPIARGGIVEGEERLQRFGPQKKLDLPSRTRHNPFLSEVDKLRNAGPSQAKLADAFDRLFANWRNMQGKYSAALDAINRLDRAAAERVYEVLIDESRAGRDLSARLTTPMEQAAYRTIRSTLAQMAQDQIAAGQPVISQHGIRTRGIDPFFAPFVIDPSVRRVLQEGQGTAEFGTLRDDFVTYQVAQGRSQKDAEGLFEKLLGSFETSPEGNRFSFQGVRLPQGVGLPDSWINRDPVAAIRKYIRSFTRDRAFWDTIETNPSLMRMLGARRFGANQPLPATTGGLPNLTRDPQVQRVLANYIGADQPYQEPISSGFGRAVNATILGGPITKLTDISTVPFKALAYTAPGHEADVAKGIASFFSDFPAILQRTYETGFNRPGAQIVAQDILGIGEYSADIFNRFAENWTKWTGSEALERGSRVLSQAIGEFIGKSQRTLARAGGTNAKAFLEKLGSDWDSISDAELGTRIGQLMQGRYDITNLPQFLRSSPIAPFLTMMRWSVEQANNFIKFAVEPAKRGDFRPLALTLIGGLGGGLAIEALRSQVSGKKHYTPTLDELQAGYGSPGFADALTYKAIGAAQVTGTMGIFSEIMKQAYEAISGRMPQGFRYPVVSVANDLQKRFFAAVNAIAEGERWELVMPALMKDVTRMHVQMARILQNQLGRLGVGEVPGTGVNLREELQEGEARRDRSVYERMADLPQAAQVQAPPSYSRLSEKQFDRGTLSEAVSAAPGLISRAVETSRGNPEVLNSQLRRLQTIGGIDAMPNPETMPMRFIEFYKWLVSTQGEAAAQETLNRFLGRRFEAGMKRQLIPSL